MNKASSSLQVEAIVDALRRLVASFDLEDSAVLPTPLASSSAVYRARRVRDRIFGQDADLFADPAWDMLLDLHICRERHRAVSVSSACIAAVVPPTTGLRYLTALVSRGLVVRVPDPHDRRRCWLELSDKGAELIEQWLNSIVATSGYSVGPPVSDLQQRALRSTDGR